LLAGIMFGTRNIKWQTLTQRTEDKTDFEISPSAT